MQILAFHALMLDPSTRLQEIRLNFKASPLPKRPRIEHVCDICGTSYSERRTLVRHQRTPAHCQRAGLAIPSYPCDRCGQEFTRDDLRHRHEREVHFNIGRSTGHTRLSSITDADTTNNGRTASSQSVQPIRGATSNPSASTVSLYGTSTPSLGSQSTPRTELEPESYQAVREHEMNDAAMDYFLHDDQSLALHSHRETRSEFNISHISPSSEQQPSNSDDRELDQSPPELIADTASIRSISTVASIKSRFLSSTNLLRSALIYKGATPRFRGYKLPVLCVLCSEHIGSNRTEVRAHLDQHSLFTEKFTCQTCQVSFAHERDLILHEMSVANGHCGFDFDHIEECQGHHPPDIFSEMLTDSDRFQFTVRLQHWEHAQLKAYLAQVNDLVQGHQMSRDGDCWSIDALFNSLVSLSSTQGYRKPRSALEPGEQLSRLDNSRLTGALANFDFRRRPQNLSRAALAGNKLKVRQLLLSGADVNAKYQLSYNHEQVEDVSLTPLMAAVKGGSLETVKLLIRHGARVNWTEDFLQSPLYYAADHGDDKLVKTLLRRGAKDMRRQALEIAASKGHTDVFRLLAGGLDDEVTVAQNIPANLLGQVCFWGRENAVQRLLTDTIDLDMLKIDHFSVLAWAIIGGSPSIILRLLEDSAQLKTDDEFEQMLLRTSGAASKPSNDTYDLASTAANICHSAETICRTLCCVIESFESCMKLSDKHKSRLSLMAIRAIAISMRTTLVKVNRDHDLVDLFGLSIGFAAAKGHKSFAECFDILAHLEYTIQLHLSTTLDSVESWQGDVGTAQWPLLDSTPTMLSQDDAIESWLRDDGTVHWPLLDSNPAVLSQEDYVLPEFGKK